MISLFKKSRIKEHNVVDIRNMSEFDYTEIVDKKINIVLGQPVAEGLAAVGAAEAQLDVHAGHRRHGLDVPAPDRGQ